VIFRILIVLSSVPPPAANTPLLVGCHAIPLIAALCLYVQTGFLDLLFQIVSFWSLEPEANVYEPWLTLNDWTFKEHTYWSWYLKIPVFLGFLKSYEKIQESSPPDRKQ
jgi:hypothetical protein